MIIQGTIEDIKSLFYSFDGLERCREKCKILNIK